MNKLTSKQIMPAFDYACKNFGAVIDDYERLGNEGPPYLFYNWMNKNANKYPETMKAIQMHLMKRAMRSAS